MKTIFLTLVCFSLTLTAQSQIASVEKSSFGIQTGFLGLWTHSEYKLNNSIVLRTELGFDSEFFGGAVYDGNGFLMTPVLTVEPRFYYNLNKRIEKSQRIDGNSGNFISMKISYRPDWFVISNQDDVSIISDIAIIPTWGLRRNIGNHFTYEAGIGIGYRYVFAKTAGSPNNYGEAIPNVHLRFGYRL